MATGPSDREISWKSGRSPRREVLREHVLSNHLPPINMSHPVPEGYVEDHIGMKVYHSFQAAEDADGETTSEDDTAISDSGVSELVSGSACSTWNSSNRHDSDFPSVSRSPSDMSTLLLSAAEANHGLRLTRSPSDGSKALRSSALSFPLDIPEEQEVMLFVEQPSEKLQCGLCKRMFREPTIVTCGHTYCKRCVNARSNELCPTDGIQMKIVIGNKTMGEQIGDLVVHCRYGCRKTVNGAWQVDPGGCPKTVKLSQRKTHENVCEYAPAACPNNPDCPPFRKKDLQAHLDQCEHVLCPHNRYGCCFHGTSEELTVHLEEECQFDALKGYLESTEAKLNDLQVVINQKDQEIGYLRSMLGKLSEKVDQLEKNTEIKFEHLEAQNHRVVEDFISARQEYEDAARLYEKLYQTGPGAYDPQQIFKCKGTCVGHQGPVWCLCVHGDFLFSGSSDKSIKIWDTASNYKCVKTLEGHTGIVLALCVYGNKLYSGSQDCSIMVWNLETFENVHTIDAHDNPVCTLTSARNMLFTGSLKVIRVWDAQTYEMKKEMSGINHWVRALITSADHLYSGSYQTIKIWDLDTLETVRILETSGGSVYSLCLTPHHLLCGTYENCIHVWELETWKREPTWMGHSGTVYALAVLHTSGGVKVFSASYDRTLRVWSMDNMICTQTLARHQGSVACLAVHRGCIFSGAVDSTVKVWQ